MIQNNICHQLIVGCIKRCQDTDKSLFFFFFFHLFHQDGERKSKLPEATFSLDQILNIQGQAVFPFFLIAFSLVVDFIFCFSTCVCAPSITILVPAVVL